ncbi:MAG TPA: hypothetical protein VFP13_08925, partial [Actinomycetota bacterium]|nr:hypothetical protein [Actinomycetota bacterium]
SVVTEASRPSVFVIETDARLERRRAETWEAHFSHRYEVLPDGRGSRIVYTEAVERVNYVPYWLRPGIIFRPWVNRADRMQPGTSLGSRRSARHSDARPGCCWTGPLKSMRVREVRCCAPERGSA